MNRHEYLASLNKLVKEDGCTLDQLVAELANIFAVRCHEIALLRAQGNQLKFVFPEELRQAGVIPLSSYSVAARTARCRRAELFNRFVQVKHSRVFEDVSLGKSETASLEPKAIQKLMSAPLIGAPDCVLGVLQVSHKGFDQTTAGPDFTNEDLDLLRLVAEMVSTIMPQLLDQLVLKPGMAQPVPESVPTNCAQA
jgi:hypothetical protein